VRPGDEGGADPVVVAHGEETHARGRGEGDLRLLQLGRAEAHRRRHVDDEPRFEVAVRDLIAHVRLTGSRGDVPVDAAHVVAGLVEP
jgi:hypothetical protein